MSSFNTGSGQGFSSQAHDYESHAYLQYPGSQNTGGNTYLQQEPSMFGNVGPTSLERGNFSAFEDDPALGGIMVPTYTLPPSTQQDIQDIFSQTQPEGDRFLPGGTNRISHLQPQDTRNYSQAMFNMNVSAVTVHDVCFALFL